MLRQLRVESLESLTGQTRTNQRLGAWCTECRGHAATVCFNFINLILVMLNADKINYYMLYFIIFPILIGYIVYISYSLHEFRYFGQTGLYVVLIIYAILYILYLKKNDYAKYGEKT